MKKGKLIVLYGINNLGKTTQAKLLVERLNKEGHPAEYLKYGIYTLEPSGPVLNRYLREGNPLNLSPREFQLVHVLNRTQYEPELLKKLESGINVIAEDYIGTGLAWGEGAGVDAGFLKQMNVHLLKEDLAFHFKGKRFLHAAENGHTHESNNDLTDRVAEVHERLARELGWLDVNANDTIGNIHEKLWEETKNIL